MVRDRLSELNANRKDDSLCGKVFFKDVCIQTSQNKKVKDVLDDVDHLRGLIETLKNNVDIVKNLHNNGLSHTNPSIKNDLENRTYIVSQMIHRIHKGLKDLAKEASQMEDFSLENFKSLNSGPAHSRIKYLQYFTMYQTFTEIVCDYNLSLNRYYDKCSLLLQQQKQLINDKNEDEDDSDDENPNTSLFVDNILEESRKAKLQLSEIQSRHNDVIKIEKTLIEIKDMFLDLNYYVAKQGEKINCVEHFAGRAIDNVEDGQIDLTKAKTKQSKHRKRKIKLIIILVLVLVIILLLAIKL